MGQTAKQWTETHCKDVTTLTLFLYCHFIRCFTIKTKYWVKLVVNEAQGRFYMQMIPCFTSTCHLLSHSGSPLSVHELHESVCGQMTQLQPKSLHSQWHFKCQCHISSGSYASSDPNAETRSHILKNPPESIFTMVQSPECRRNSLFQTDCLIHSSTWMTCWSSVTKDTLKASLFLSYTHTHTHTNRNIQI